ncbi:MAG: SDR family oxidoreductase [bacterium]
MIDKYRIFQENKNSNRDLPSKKRRFVMLHFKGKTAVITGGSSGIGLATAECLAKAGANVFLVARNVARLRTAAAKIREIAGIGEVAIFPGDVRRQSQMHQTMAHAAKWGGTDRIDILVNSAGITHPGYFSSLTEDTFAGLMETNYFGTLNAIRAAYPYMANHYQGHIVIVSSVAGHMGVYGYSAYASTKAAVTVLGETLSDEFRPLGINVSIVFPPDTYTPQLVQENRIKPPETKAISGNIKPVMPAVIGTAILAGIRKKRLYILPGVQNKILFYLGRPLAPLLHWYVGHIVKNVQSQQLQSGLAEIPR